MLLRPRPPGGACRGPPRERLVPAHRLSLRPRRTAGPVRGVAPALARLCLARRQRGCLARPLRRVWMSGYGGALDTAGLDVWIRC